jgi:hypothetical protein
MITTNRLFRFLVLCLVLLVYLALSSCSTSRQHRRQSRCEKAFYKYGCDWAVPDTVTQTDFVLKLKDTTIFVRIEGDTRYDSIPVPVNISTPVNILKTRYAVSQAWIEKGVLHHELQQLQSEIASTIPNAISSATLHSVRTLKIPFPQEVPVKMPLSWLEKVLMYSGAAAWFILLFLLFLRFRKLFSRFRYL